MPSAKDAKINSGLCLVYKVLNIWISLCLLLLGRQGVYRADQCPSQPPGACCLMGPQRNSFHHFSLHKIFPGLPTEAAERSQSYTSLLWSLPSDLRVVANYFKPFSPVKFVGRNCQHWVCLSVFVKREAAQLRWDPMHHVSWRSTADRRGKSQKGIRKQKLLLEVMQDS